MIFRRSKRFQKISKKKINDRVALVCNRYSAQLVCNLTESRTLPMVLSGEIFENGLLWTAASKQSKRKISKKAFLVESF